MSETKNGIPFDQLYLVRVQNGLNADYVDETNSLVLDRSGSGRAKQRNTCHFTINAIVKNHIKGSQFDGAEYVFIAPFLRAMREGGNVPSGLSAGDTWFHADEKSHMRLPGAQILLPDDAALSPEFEPLAKRYPRGKTPQETMANRNTAVEGWFHAERAPLFDLGGEGGKSLPWSGEKKGSQHNSLPDDQKVFFEGLARHVFPNYEIAIGQLHDNSLDATWDARYSDRRFNLEAERYASGETKYMDDSFNERSTFDHLTKSMEESALFIKDRKEKNAPPHALAHYLHEYRANAVVFERTVLPSRRREVEQKMTNDIWIYDGEKWGECALTSREFISLAQKGGVEDHHTIRQEYNGEISMTRYGGSRNQSLVQSLNYRIPSLEAPPLVGKDDLSVEGIGAVRPVMTWRCKGFQHNH